MTSAIEFMRMWRGKPAGTIDREMGYGVHDTLVRRGIAKFISQPVAVQIEAEPETQPQPVRERKPRRSFSTKE